MPIEPSSPQVIRDAAERLDDGQLVVLPTETVYGLAADAANPEAVEGVFERKRRPPSNPLIVHVADAIMAQRAAAEWTAIASALCEAFWPGPLTLVVPRSGGVPDSITAGGDTVALRCPAHHVARDVIAALGRPVVAPSANPSGYVSPTTAEHAAAHFPDLLVVDGGPCRVGIESTVLRLEPMEILRPGAVGEAAIAAVVGSSPAHASRSADRAEASPGRLGPHYQPRASVEVVASDEGCPASPGGRCVAIVPSGRWVRFEERIELPCDAAGYAAGLYAALREADARGARLIKVADPRPHANDPDAPLWAAVMERLSRASGGEVTGGSPEP